MRVRTVALALCLGSMIAASQSTTNRPKTPPPSARDSRIREAAAKVLAEHEECKRVKVEVEDRIVTLTGKVEMASDRAWLAQRMKRIPDVSRVNNQLVLDPPAELDEVLLARVKRSLSAPHFAGVRFTVHEGLVKLSGEVRTHGDASRAYNAAMSTAGVREVESGIRVMENY